MNHHPRVRNANISVLRETEITFPGYWFLLVKCSTIQCSDDDVMSCNVLVGSRQSDDESLKIARASERFRPRDLLRCYFDVAVMRVLLRVAFDKYLLTSVTEVSR